MRQRVKRHKFGWISGVHHSPKSPKVINYKSKMELLVCQYLDSSNRVKSYYYEAVKLPYMVSLRGRVFRKNYIPDFIIQFVDNTKEMWEVKPLKETTNPINVAKFRSGNNFCKRFGMKFRIVTEGIISGLLRGV